MRSESIVEFTPVNFTEGRNTEEKAQQIVNAIERLKRDLIYILSDFETRIDALENK